MIDSDGRMGVGGWGDFPSEVHLIYALKNEHNVFNDKGENLRINRTLYYEAQMS